ncbi:aminotransferase class I/II-fold pyridoxal phosphate-dependent enzyme [bacterium]|nr:aminotransferase class I/II-fold pyridoxal phosphate-dependent enzyme [bacterium]
MIQKLDERDTTLYRQTAEKVAHLIREGTLRAGDRLPSVRELSRDWEISISTVVQAYRLLENQGLIEARPQSGFYVKATLLQRLPEPSVIPPTDSPVDVTKSALHLQIMQDSQDPRLLKLGAAVPDPELLPAAKLNRIMGAIGRRKPHRAVAYEFPPGARELRVAIARRAISHGLDLTPDDLVITTGAHEALVLALRAVTRPGDTVAIESPTFYGLFNVLEALHLRAVEVPTNPREGMSLEALEVILESHRPAAIITIPNFHNPLGFLMSDERKKRLVELAAERHVPLIEDDIYADFYREERPRCLRTFDRTGGVMTVSSFSKTIAPGYRIGYIAPGKYLREVLQGKLMLNVATATLPQLAIAEFLMEGSYDHHLRGLRRELAQRVDFLSDLTARHFPEGTHITRPAGGFILWAQFPPSVDAYRLYREAIKVGITIMPGPQFSPREDAFRSCVRLNAAFVKPGCEGRIAELGDLARKVARG